MVCLFDHIVARKMFSGSSFETANFLGQRKLSNSRIPTSNILHFFILSFNYPLFCYRLNPFCIIYSVKCFIIWYFLPFTFQQEMHQSTITSSFSWLRITAKLSTVTNAKRNKLHNRIYGVSDANLISNKDMEHPSRFLKTGAF